MHSDTNIVKPPEPCSLLGVVELSCVTHKSSLYSLNLMKISAVSILTYSKSQVSIGDVTVIHVLLQHSFLI